MSNTKQRSFYMHDKKIMIKSRPKTRLGKKIGWYVFINFKGKNKKHFVNALVCSPTSQERRVVEDVAFARCLKKNWWTAFNKAEE